MRQDFNTVISGDGTTTLHCDEYDETMHSDSGAYHEAMHMHLLPSGLLQKEEPRINVLDIGFGLGYNILALIHEVLKKSPHASIHVTSLEKDTGYSDRIKAIVFDDDRGIIYEAVKLAFQQGRASFGNCTITVIFDDARNSIQRLEPETYHAAFHDPFSPSKNPELWSVEFFSSMKRVMKKNSIITTYSSAPQIRRAFLDAGFITGPGPSVGRKKEGTRAATGPVIDPFSPVVFNELQHSIKATPYRDPELKDTRDNLLMRRINEMNEKRVRACHQAHQK